MKRLFFISMLFSLGVACNKNEEIVTPKDSANEEKVEKIDEFQTPGDKVVTATEALTRADAILSRFQTRSTPRVVKSCEYFVAKPATRSLADTIEVAFHLINYEHNAGFAMVAADERATDVYAYSEEGQLTAADFEENPGLRIYKEIATEVYQAEVRGLIAPPDNPWPDDPIGPVTPTPNDRPNGVLVQQPDGSWLIRQVTADRSHKLNPLLKTEWHQRAPYNYFCNGNKAGCTPIAIAQIFTYHGYPPSYNGYVFNWNTMEDNFYEYEFLSRYVDVASLIRFIGLEANTNYGEDSSSTLNSNIVETIRAFGYHSTHRETFKQATMALNLRLNYPLLMLGFDGSSILFDTGHTWVVDGYDLDDYDYVYYEADPPYSVCGGGNFYQVYFHVNWGWGPNSTTANGFYHLPDQIEYKHHVDVVYEIYPNN